MEAKDIVKKLKSLRAWSKFDRNYMNPKNPKLEWEETTMEFLERDAHRGFSSCIKRAFSWASTPEGSKYWLEISEK